MKRLIDPEPWVIKNLMERKTIIRRPYREYYLSFVGEVAKELRSRDLWVKVISMTVANSAITYLLKEMGILKYRGR